MSYLPFWIEAAAYKTSLVQSFFIEVPVANAVEWAVSITVCNSPCNSYCNCLIVDRFVMDPKLMDDNLIDRLHQPLIKTIPHYLDKLRSLDQSINDMQHIMESYIYILIILTRNVTNYVFVCLFWWCFSFIVAVSFTGGGNRRTQRKPLTCRKSLTNFIT